jgi:hypothetical protein
VIRAVRSRRRSAPVLTVVATVITAGLALLLLGASEYGAQIFPPLWRILAILPAQAIEAERVRVHASGPVNARAAYLKLR